MTKRNLSRALIISTAFSMIDEKGTGAFSIRQLATRLGVQVSSLYNHIDNEYDLLLEVARCSADMYADYVAEMVDGLSPVEAAYKGGDAFRTFINQHKYLYALLLDSRWIGDPEFAKVTERFTQPIGTLTFDGIDDKEALEHIYIAMRVVTHGFSSLDALGVFDELSIDTTESYHKLIKCVVDMMADLAKKSED